MDPIPKSPLSDVQLRRREYFQLTQHLLPELPPPPVLSSSSINMEAPSSPLSQAPKVPSQQRTYFDGTVKLDNSSPFHSGLNVLMEASSSGCHESPSSSTSQHPRPPPSPMDQSHVGAPSMPYHSRAPMSRLGPPPEYDEPFRARANTWHGQRADKSQDDKSSPSESTATLQSIGESTKKTTARRNAWGNSSYADLITQAIESSPEKRLTLSQVYDWMVQNVEYFKGKGDSNSSAGWKNSIRHNLSLHSRFVRVQNEGTGKSSWWTLNPDSKAGATKTHRRRANTVESQKCGDKKRKGRSKKTSAELSPVMGSSVGLTTGSMNMLNLEGGSSGGPSLSPTSSSVSESLDFTSTVTLSGDQLETFGASSSISDSLDPYSSQPGTPLRHNNSYCLAGDLPQLSSSGRDDIRQILSSTSSSSSAWTGFPSYTQSSMEFATNGDHGMLDTLKLAQKLSVKSNGSSVGSPGGSGFHSPNVSSSSSPSSTVTSRIPQPPTSGPPQITPLRIGSNGYVPGSAYGSFGGASSSHLPPQSQSTQEFSPTPPVTTQSSTLGYTALSPAASSQATSGLSEYSAAPHHLPQQPPSTETHLIASLATKPLNEPPSTLMGQLCEMDLSLEGWMDYNVEEFLKPDLDFLGTTAVPHNHHN